MALINEVLNHNSKWGSKRERVGGWVGSIVERFRRLAKLDLPGKDAGTGARTQGHVARGLEGERDHLHVRAHRPALDLEVELVVCASNHLATHGGEGHRVGVAHLGGEVVLCKGRLGCGGEATRRGGAGGGSFAPPPAPP